MKTLTCYAALCAALAMSGAVQAQTAFEDPLYQGRVLEFSLGLFAPFNSLQDTLTTPNGGGAQVQSTDQLALVLVVGLTPPIASRGAATRVLSSI